MPIKTEAEIRQRLASLREKTLILRTKRLNWSADINEIIIKELMWVLGEPTNV
jgi:hypothetical protein